MRGASVTTDNAVVAPQIRISERALAEAEARAFLATPNEFGGILIGWWEGDAIAVVHDMLSVPDLRAGHGHYERGHSPAQQILDEYLQTMPEPNTGYIGEWHSHPAPQPPSSIDHSALSGIVRQARRPVALVVLSMTPDDEVQPHGLIGRPRWPRRASIEHASIERM
jgi:hypothetical protein